MYSTLWNIFRSSDVRNQIPLLFLQRIFNDYVNISQFNEERLYNVYFGALSNISLSNHKNQILQFIKNIDYPDKMDETNKTTISGLLANLSVDHDNAISVLSSKIFKGFIESIDGTEKTNVFLRNFLALLNNLHDVKSILYTFVKFKIVEKLQLFPKLENEIDEEDIKFLYLGVKNMYDFHISESSLHIANKNNFSDIIYKMIYEEECNLNVQDHKGNTVLHYALKNENFKLAKLYIVNNADCKILNKNNKSPYDFNKNFINKINNKRDKIVKAYYEDVKTFCDKEMGDNYEINLCNIVNGFINKTKDLKVLVEM